ncbi:MAG: hypothetical protein IPO58_00295 [Betaproteobacteria bacterium]|nr:hypothetical protein [Betaproteobacteria bacterium]MBK9604937.1 hypothetical protein [Betaproteobacteria bacterium]
MNAGIDFGTSTCSIGVWKNGQPDLLKLEGDSARLAAQAQTAPDVIYVTGGTAKSPMILECIRANFGGVDIVVGDLFGSVTSGLATWAQRTFR